MGPAGVGMALLNGRAAAAAARTEKILEDARSAREAAEGGLGWVPARDATLGRRPACAVPPLLELCVRLIRDHIEDVESLWGLPDAIKVPYWRRRPSSVPHAMQLPRSSTPWFSLTWPLEEYTFGVVRMQSHVFSCK